MKGFDRNTLERARLSRDARFDGKFFIAVTSTGIYCRPVCPARTPKAANVRYYGTAAEAAEAGFRPCLRCRPEAAPGTPAWMGTSAVVRRGLRLIHEGFLDEASVQMLAASLGVGARHLHRLFVRHVGASPLALAQTRRLHFAKGLLDATDLPMLEIALAAGYGSLRRFNDAFLGTYGRAPRELRRLRRRGLASDARDELVLKLAFRPPYDWPQVRDFLAVRAVPGVERVDARGYARTVATARGPARICVRALEGEPALELRVRGAAPEALFQIASTVRRVFDVAADPGRVAQALRADPLFAPLVRLRPGLRIPGAWDPFECAVRAVLSDGAKAAAARGWAARLVAAVGQPLEGGADGLTHLFPTAGALAEADLKSLGLAGARAGALLTLARAVLDGSLDFSAGPEELLPALARLDGLGAATQQHVALYGLGEPDAFPAADRTLRRMAAAGRAPLSAAALAARAESWRPWRGYAAQQLWHAAGEPSDRGAPRRMAQGSAGKAREAWPNT